MHHFVGTASRPGSPSATPTIRPPSVAVPRYPFCSLMRELNKVWICIPYNPRTRWSLASAHTSGFLKCCTVLPYHTKDT